MLELNKIYQGDSLAVLKTLPDESVDCCVTSPPYWSLRDYQVAGQLGHEPTFQEFVTNLCDIFDEVKRVLKGSGTCWVVIGDTYAGQGGPSRHFGYSDPKHPKGRAGNFEEPASLPQVGAQSKSLCQIPSRFAIEMTNRGWILRNEIVWHKPNVMPSSATDRFSIDFEKVFFFTKNKKYWFEQQLEPYTTSLNRWGGNWTKKTSGSLWSQGTGQPLHRTRNNRPNKAGRNKRTVWSINTKPFFNDKHFATYPVALIEPMIRAGCPASGIVLDPFMGAGTTGLVARGLGRNYVGIELSKTYCDMAKQRIEEECGALF